MDYLEHLSKLSLVDRVLWKLSELLSEQFQVGLTGTSLSRVAKWEMESGIERIRMFTVLMKARDNRDKIYIDSIVAKRVQNDIAALGLAIYQCKTLSFIVIFGA